MYKVCWKTNHKRHFFYNELQNVFLWAFVLSSLLSWKIKLQWEWIYFVSYFVFSSCKFQKPCDRITFLRYTEPMTSTEKIYMCNSVPKILLCYCPLEKKDFLFVNFSWFFFIKILCFSKLNYQKSCLEDQRIRDNKYGRFRISLIFWNLTGKISHATEWNKT